MKVDGFEVRGAFNSGSRKYLDIPKTSKQCRWFPYGGLGCLGRLQGDHDSAAYQMPIICMRDRKTTNCLRREVRLWSCSGMITHGYHGAVESFLQRGSVAPNFVRKEEYSRAR